MAAQLRALRDYAARNGYVVVREYIDEAKSVRINDRPEFNRMIDEARSPEAPFREVLVWKFSRFTRNREHAIAYKSLLRRRGVTVVSITEQTDDTPAGTLTEGIIETVDEYYSEDLADGCQARYAGSRLPRLLGLQQDALWLQEGPWSMMGRRSAPDCNLTTLRHPSSGASSTWPRPD